MPNLNLVPIGGFGEVGRNCLLLENSITGGKCLLDAGILIKRKELGQDVDILPKVDLLKSVLVNNARKISAVFITHGHIDHVGGVGEISNYDFGTENIKPIPAYMSKIAFEFYLQMCRNNAHNSLRRQGYSKEYDEEYRGMYSYIVRNSLPCNLRDKSRDKYFIKDGFFYKIGNFEISFFKVNHSIPDSFVVLVRCNGVCMAFFPDFKIAGYSPEDEVITRESLQKILSRGPIDILLIDALYSSVSGYTQPECLAVENIKEEIIKARSKKKRVFLTFHASNLRLMSELYELAKYLTNASPVFLGRAMKSAEKISGLSGSEKDWQDAEIIFTTGCQAEGAPAQSRLVGIASELSSSDVVIFSSGAIPGNFDAVKGLVYKLDGQNAEVVLNEGEKEKLDIPWNWHNVREAMVHVSGHEMAGGKQEIVEKIYKGNKGHPLTVIPYHAEGDDLEAFRELVPEGARLEVLNNGDLFTI